MAAAGPLVGVLGGTFDPIHHGHLRIALELQEQLRLDGLHLIPAAIPPHRATATATPQQRLAMVRLAVAGMPQWVADGIELARAGPSYSVETIEALQRQLGPDVRLVLLLGSDAFAALHTWHRWQALRALVQVVVATRPGYPLGVEHLAPPLRSWFASGGERATAALRDAPLGGVWQLPVAGLEISASAIRRLSAEGRSLRYLLPDGVQTYIQQHGIYR